VAYLSPSSEGLTGVAFEQVRFAKHYRGASDATARRNRRAVVSACLIRAMDIVVACAALVLFAPLMVLIAAIIPVTSGGPILFRQIRLGLNGRSFTCLKFRTMHQDADRLLGNLLADCARSRDEWERDRKLQGDPRVIWVGKLLRRTSLDELPQIFNVLRGDMSIVGPRPIVGEEAARYGRHIRSYYAVKPGITGLWQVSGRNETTYRRRVACDVAYARRRSPMTNLAIMVRTVPVVIGAKGAY
jgi:exopolysaccharide production protein ExoY